MRFNHLLFSWARHYARQVIIKKLEPVLLDLCVENSSSGVLSNTETKIVAPRYDTSLSKVCAVHIIRSGSLRASSDREY